MSIPLRRVNPIGPLDAKIVIIGEAPDNEENIQGIPFVGAAGNLLDSILSGIGIDRDSIYLTNVIKYQPPRNNLNKLGEIGLDLDTCIQELEAELDTLNPNIVIPLGAAALKATTGLNNIKNWRGSILSGYKGYKTLPTLHPAKALRQWINVHLIARDLKKALAQSVSPDINLDSRTYITNPTFLEVVKWLDIFKSSEYLCIDLETFYRKGAIRCIGLCDNPSIGISIPMLRGYKREWSEDEETYILETIRELLIDKGVKKIAQNAPFEMLQLEELTYGTNWIYMDTLRAHSLLYPEWPHDLALLTSIYTDMPFYKEESKIASDKGDFTLYQEYNVKDVLATFETALKLEVELGTLKQTAFYHELDNPLMYSLWKIQRKGVKIDINRRDKHKKAEESKLLDLEQRFEAKVGYTLNVKSSKQMCKFLYTDLGLTKQYMTNPKTGKKALTANAKALEKLYSKYNLPELVMLEDMSKLRTLIEGFLNRKLSIDNRFRTAYGITKSYRLKSKKDLLGEGTNLQNIPPSIRDTFIPDNFSLTPLLQVHDELDWSFWNLWIKADLAQAEARVVAWEAEDEAMIRLFESGGDIHKLVASYIFDKDVSDITKDERQLSKKIVHAVNYGMGVYTFANNARVSIPYARIIMNQYKDAFPMIFYWQAKIEQEIKSTRTLKSPTGGIRRFYGRLDKATFREGFSWIPQNVIATIINKALIRLDNMYLADITDINTILPILKKELEQTIYIKGRPLIIPVDFKVGPNWGNLTEVVV